MTGAARWMETVSLWWRMNIYNGNIAGNLVNWWEDDARSEYLERAQCIIDQYDNYTVQVGEEQLNVNGVNTQGENIADNGGIKEALLSYLSLVSRLGPEPSLPGLPFTPRQLFWLSGASPWCSVSRPQSLKLQVSVQSYSAVLS